MQIAFSLSVKAERSSVRTGHQNARQQAGAKIAKDQLPGGSSSVLFSSVQEGRRSDIEWRRRCQRIRGHTSLDPSLGKLLLVVR